MYVQCMYVCMYVCMYMYVQYECMHIYNVLLLNEKLCVLVQICSESKEKQRAGMKNAGHATRTHSFSFKCIRTVPTAK